MPGRAPGREEDQVTFADIATDWEASDPKLGFSLIIFVGGEIGEGSQWRLNRKTSTFLLLGAERCCHACLLAIEMLSPEEFCNAGVNLRQFRFADAIGWHDVNGVA